MISKNKIIALILGVSLASSATYESYAYFSGEYSVKNTVKIVELDPKESPFEISKISTRENSLVLELSKKVFYSGEDINSDIVGSETFLDNVEISIEVIDQPNNEVKEESSIENSNNEVEDIETPKSGDENTTPVEGKNLSKEENLEQKNINGNELNKSLGKGEISNNLTNIN
ncbi:TPA: hypothetical protein I9081_002152 [Clostridium perfringens]|uniref:hypothetical protein n=1 Tax=Clostridium perfringens TaxID=1502 RepID=UPI000E11C116|nr:hypothetical protein [Clostridium perfringens]EJT6150308.1 hypothetical protein [Clostridium perfringens]EJT6155932.1 hypothetical protein [Clostridium perfringens]MDK0889013.1 hypothetical protein [Clostridium perfringens]UBK57894.1 hypothetical protein KLF43_11560 [Clostridium perfringens]UBK65890.1 hypothetical protein KLF46_11535 [Clostridium perfringens]